MIGLLTLGGSGIGTGNLNKVSAFEVGLSLTCFRDLIIMIRHWSTCEKKIIKI